MRILSRPRPPRQGRLVTRPHRASQVPELSLEQLAGLAEHAVALQAELGVPPLTPEEDRDLVLVLDPRVRVTADALAHTLAGVPQVAQRSGQDPATLEERDAQISALLGVQRLAEQAERAFRRLRVLAYAVEEEILAQLAEELAREKAALADRPEELARLLGEAADLEELVAQGRERQRASRAATAREAEAVAEQVAASQAEARALRTLVAIHAGEPVSEQEVAEAEAYLTRLAGQGRAQPR
ncbi:MAG: hypothetical protein RMK29_10910 [Myxococcales bacterium]|nr:hypothetical protein [Myxococcota bacterium]MDW8282215.1 hypothetical protein [Myxococcales bacterium]